MIRTPTPAAAFATSRSRNWLPISPALKPKIRMWTSGVAASMSSSMPREERRAVDEQLPARRRRRLEVERELAAVTGVRPRTASTSPRALDGDDARNRVRDCPATARRDEDDRTGDDRAEEQDEAAMLRKGSGPPLRTDRARRTRGCIGCRRPRPTATLCRDCATSPAWSGPWNWAMNPSPRDEATVTGAERRHRIAPPTARRGSRRGDRHAEPADVDPPGQRHRRRPLRRLRHHPAEGRRLQRGQGCPPGADLRPRSSRSRSSASSPGSRAASCSAS